MPFALMDEPFNFQKVIDHQFSDLKVLHTNWNDTVIALTDNKDHESHLEILLSRIEELGLKIKMSKCSFVRD